MIISESLEIITANIGPKLFIFNAGQIVNILLVE